ncbi:tyrosine-type recombinase/integrase [Viridibacillus sp. FSL E2-0187]|uniref:tyrosine-type recombinase/integrase n=1 Tax=Viridibacillus sp. FSL E2-0187 TaxID=2921362 RepID=UPI0030F665F0
MKSTIGLNYYELDFLITKLGPSYFGYPYHLKTANTRMQSILRIMNTIKKHLISPSFRHTHTSLLAKANVPLNLIMAQLGHESDETTKKVASQKFSEKPLSYTIFIISINILIIFLKTLSYQGLMNTLQSIRI